MTILFDLDGTVIDSTEAIIESFGVAFRAFDMSPPNEQDIVKQIGNPLSVMFERNGAPNELNDALVARYKEHYRTVANQKTYLLPNAKEAVEIASEVAVLGVVTTKTGRYSKEILEHLGILRHFGAIVGFEDVQNPKPHPEPILKALGMLEKNPSEKVFMIGDTRLDVYAANDAGIRHIAVSSGYEGIDSLKQVTSYIENDVLAAVLAIKRLA